MKHDHLKYCEERCRHEYMECLKVTKQARLVFPTMNEAIEWLKRHPREVFVGSVVFVGGVALVVVVMAGGLVILAPI